MKSRADWGNRQGNSARCFLHFLNEINDLVRHFEPISRPSSGPSSRGEGPMSLGRVAVRMLALFCTARAPKRWTL